MEIKVLGSSCKKCEKVYKLINEILNEENISANVEKVETLKEIVSYGVMRTPTTIINDDILFVGMVPSKKKLLKEIKDRI